MSFDTGESRVLAASFRDPNGFLFNRDGHLYRQVNQLYQAEYTRLMESGLYQELVADGLLIPHSEVEIAPAISEPGWKVIQPEKLDFISYPYEWSFSQYKDAALTTLNIQKRALQRGLWLKDASAYNIQFRHGRPLLIDTLSFETYPEGRPWVAYRQFCQHFLATLNLMARVDIRLGSLMRVHIDGVPIDLASRLLPLNTRFSLPLLMHLHWHAASQKRFAGQALRTSATFSKVAMQGLVENLESSIQGLRWSPGGTAWSGYYDDDHNYTAAGLEHKLSLVESYLQTAAPANLWDLGANTGLFSRLAARAGIPTIAFDVDPGAVELNYRKCRQDQDQNLLPLLMDLTNPSPGSGWHNQERMSLLQRGPAAAVMALALVHHLAITNNVPLNKLAELLAGCGEWLVVEFVPKSDLQVQRLLVSRQDIFPNYTREGFESAFTERFNILRSDLIRDFTAGALLDEAEISYTLCQKRNR